MHTQLDDLLREAAITLAELLQQILHKALDKLSLLQLQIIPVSTLKLTNTVHAQWHTHSQQRFITSTCKLLGCTHWCCVQETMHAKLPDEHCTLGLDRNLSARFWHSSTMMVDGLTT